jgi:hypothetical protein
VQIDIRLSGQASETRKHVAELVDLHRISLYQRYSGSRPLLQATFCANCIL